MKKAVLFLSTALITAMILSSFVSFSNEVTIGKQVWMTENLNVDRFRNGDSILQAKTDEEWVKAAENGEPAWCYFDNDPKNGAKYGKLYNWYAVNDPRGLVPSGWHVPSDSEWTTLIDYLGGRDLASEKMKSTSGWEDNGNGTNESGFSGLPSGHRGIIGTFSSLGFNGNFWSSTESESDMEKAWCRLLYCCYGYVFREAYLKKVGLSVRCIRD